MFEIIGTPRKQISASHLKPVNKMGNGKINLQKLYLSGIK